VWSYEAVATEGKSALGSEIRRAGTEGRNADSESRLHRKKLFELMKDIWKEIMSMQTGGGSFKVRIYRLG
jgi:hypothetical protein